MRRNTTGHRSIGLIFPFARIATGFMLLAATLNLPAARGAEKPPIADKTLVAWVAPANLAQRGGSVLTLEEGRRNLRRYRLRRDRTVEMDGRQQQLQPHPDGTG